MSRIEELEKQITELDERKVALQHELEVEKQKMKIEYPSLRLNEHYWLINNDGEISRSWWSRDGIDKGRCEISNFFLTEEEATKERDRRILLTRFKQFRDKCNGDWKPDWKNKGNDCEYYNIDFTYHDGKAEFGTDWHRYFHPFCLFGYFKEQKDVERAIELFGDEIKRLFVEEEK